MKTDYAGIDYGLGRSNVDDNGIRYGVINQNYVGQVWYDESEPYYGETITCQNCEQDVDVNASQCPNCEEEEFWPDMIEAVSYFFEDNEYSAECGEDGDIFITKSPYYTYAQFCSPCAPGAGYLMNELAEKIESNKTYCFGHDWFENGAAPYDVYSVETNKLIKGN